ncbi:methionine aminopeptidase [Kytococcus sedentarius]|uniref:methionine aminopeptidase n=1 Tax=Kytococcus sedentarius TaxID=1276 RepID=UPI00194E1280|nr:methionine aminopeptidase [Kytococcus sedentarius]QRO88236.1 methionine aminopeptidase [Kytococcus sedentarius]
MSFYYNIVTGQVEESGDSRSRNADVMGPYDTREEAQNALATARANTEKWDAQRAEEADQPGGANWDSNPLNG